jgi:hypothetical protein
VNRIDAALRNVLMPRMRAELDRLFNGNVLQRHFYPELSLNIDVSKLSDDVVEALIMASYSEDVDVD